MNVYIVSLFGHRKVDNLRLIEERLGKIARELIRTKEYVEFLVGRNGEFDEYAAAVIKRAQKEAGKENNSITLVLPYKISGIEYYEKYYDSIIIPENVFCVHPKSAITLKNQWMVEQSKLVIGYVERNEGGAYTALKYAKKMNKDIINLYKDIVEKK